jgi:hypothetical protein
LVSFNFFLSFGGKRLCATFASILIKNKNIMRKTLFMMTWLLLAFLVANAQQMGNRFPLSLSVDRVKTSPIGKPIPRSPICPPYLEMEGRTLYFDTDHAAFTVMLVDEDEQVVYQVAVPSTVDEIELPSTLSGVFELQIYDGTDYYFYCDIYLE